MNGPDVDRDPAALWAEAQATRILEDRPDAPPYGSPEWSALHPNDPRRFAAVLVAAEQWRRQETRQAWLDELADDDPETWYREVTADADRAASRLGRTLASTPTWPEVLRRRQHKPPTPVAASPGWSPVAIPGRPGWWRHYVNGRQVDLSSRDAPRQEHAA